MAIAVGDTVEIIGHRNAYGEDISSWRAHTFNAGDTFVVGRVEDDDDGYPCPIVFPEGERSDFFREDDLLLVTRSDVADRVREVREIQGVGLLEARRIVEREDLLSAIDAAQSVEDLKAIIRRLVR